MKTSQLGASAYVQSIVQYEILQDAALLSVAPKDLNKNFKTIKKAALLSIFTNDPNGYVLNIGVQDVPYLDRVEATVQGVYLVTIIPGLTEMIHILGNAGTETRWIAYKFIFSADASAGEFPWPVQAAAFPF